MMHDSYCWGMPFMGWFFWLLIIAVVIMFFRKYSDKSSRESTETALDILKKRYAKGEITKQQFDEMKKDL